MDADDLIPKYYVAYRLMIPSFYWIYCRTEQDGSEQDLLAPSKATILWTGIEPGDACESCYHEAQELIARKMSTPTGVPNDMRRISSGMAN
jgi:hypothetical protein